MTFLSVDSEYKTIFFTCAHTKKNGDKFLIWLCKLINFYRCFARCARERHTEQRERERERERERKDQNVSCDDKLLYFILTETDWYWPMSMFLVWPISNNKMGVPISFSCRRRGQIIHLGQHDVHCTKCNHDDHETRQYMEPCNIRNAKFSYISMFIHTQMSIVQNIIRKWITGSTTICRLIMEINNIRASFANGSHENFN
jgi:hypothetical protein